MTSAILSLLFYQASVTFHLPGGLLESLCYVESTHNVSAVHHDDGSSDSLGICQVKYRSAQWMGYDGSEKGLMRPSVNIYYAAKYLAYQMRRYDGDVTRAVVAYNRGNAKGLTHTDYSDKVMDAWMRGF